MEDGIERSMSFLIADLEKKQQIVAMPKYEEQVHPIGLSLTGRSDTTPIGHDNTPISRETTHISHHTRPIGCAQTLVKPTPNLPSTNTGSDS